MADEQIEVPETKPEGEASEQPAPAAAEQATAPEQAAPPAAEPPAQSKPEQGERPQRGPQNREPRNGGDRGPKGPRPQGQEQRQGQNQRGQQGGGRGPQAGGGRPEGRGEGRGEGRPEGRGGDRRDDRRGDRGGRPDLAVEIELEKLMADSLYLDNQAHAIVARMRDMDSGTKSQLRRFYNAVRRAVRAPEGERQHEFVMLRARLAYTIARHSLRSLDTLEKLLLQVTRKNDARGYERFKDLFEAIVAYNE
jgi:CRISPR type III-A-associated protein Csm2